MTKINKTRKIYSPIKQKVLLLLAAGVALGLNRSPKRTRYIFRSLAKEWRRINRRYLYRLLRELKEERLVKYQERPNGMIEIKLGERGKQKVLVFNIDSLAIKPPARWDGRWRIVLFDVPEQKRTIRDAFRNKLRELGFYEWQKSVFVYPFPCRDEIDFIVEFFGARQFVRQAEFSNPTNEAELKLYFNLD